MDKSAIKSSHPQKDLVDICQPYDGHHMRIKNVLNSGVGLSDLSSEFRGELTVAGDGGLKIKKLWSQGNLLCIFACSAMLTASTLPSCPTFDNNFQNFKSFERIIVHPV